MSAFSSHVYCVALKSKSRKTISIETMYFKCVSHWAPPSPKGPRFHNFQRNWLDTTLWCVFEFSIEKTIHRNGSETSWCKREKSVDQPITDHGSLTSKWVFSIKQSPLLQIMESASLTGYFGDMNKYCWFWQQCNRNGKRPKSTYNGINRGSFRGICDWFAIITIDFTDCCGNWIIHLCDASFFGNVPHENNTNTTKSASNKNSF